MKNTNPRIQILKKDIEQQILKPLRSHGWSASIIHEHDNHSSVEFSTSKQNRTANFAVVYSSATDNEHYKILATRNERIFYHGQAYQLEIYARNVSVPVEPMGDFFPVLVQLNKEIEPDKTSAIGVFKKKRSKRITDENPQQAVASRLEQFTSVKLCEKLIRRRCIDDGCVLSNEIIRSKSAGVAYAMRNALDYYRDNKNSSLNKRILGLYYGTLAFAFAEMLASPNGPNDLDDVESMTKFGHGLYTIQDDLHSIQGLRIGVLATGFLPRWLNFLGHDISDFPTKKAKNLGDLETQAHNMSCQFSDLLGSFPEVDDLYQDVFGAEPSWVIPVYDTFGNEQPSIHASGKKADSSYCKFIDYSGKIAASRLANSGLPIAEIRKINASDWDYEGHAYHVRVDHKGHKLWWDVIPTHNSPSKHRTTILLPTIGGLREYRILALIALYALSIAVRYMPGTWRRVEGGDTDEYLAIIKSLLSSWERVLPEQFLESIADEDVYTAQPGSWMS